MSRASNQDTLYVTPASIKKPAAIASILDGPFKLKPRIVPASAIKASSSTQRSETIPPSDSKIAVYQLRKVMTIEVRPSLRRHAGSSRRSAFLQPWNDKISSTGIAGIAVIARIPCTQLSMSIVSA
jgi:hypothetical protein